MEIGTGKSYAKIILIGEHAVVYGEPAIALPVKSIGLSARVAPLPDGRQEVTSAFFTGDLNAGQLTNFAGIAMLIRRLLVFFDASKQGFHLTITSALPSERGMGSSAATAVAVVRAFYDAFQTPLTRTALLNWADISEKALHGNPSGLDAATASAEKPQWFVRGKSLRSIMMPRNGVLLIADTGIAGQTKVAVDLVAQKLKQAPKVYRPLITDIGTAVRQAALALAQDDIIMLGQLLNRDQADLAALGVSSPELDRLINVAIDHGAYGAKLTGSGIGGCMIALAAEDQAPTIIQALKAANAVKVWEYHFETK
ncbi:mevalonate kinase [Lacticaseibacillus parahuelsenbergensis]|uniref:Mevalonate kinase n=1 Tax=Lacticaseibacillus parahuelsenbergensis TaxID=3068305 RepID=A0ABY9L6Q3_9LACO|nr:mevalonate kinase [Lacticaseibacillus sp. NCIMB 15471]WLV79337.1 mevalonate kinase [Lacticaseibacillus sp. NCIMB 15471]